MALLLLSFLYSFRVFAHAELAGAGSLWVCALGPEPHLPLIPESKIGTSALP